MVKRHNFKQFQTRDWKASIVIPALNEAEYIERSLTTIIDAVDALDEINSVDIFIVDNGSDDETGETIEDLTTGRKNFHLLSELRTGIGYARQTGATTALHYAQEENISNNGFWIISTAADVLVPKDWLINWFTLFQTVNSGIITGNSRFPADLSVTNPHASQIMETVGKKIAFAERTFGIINTDGNNFAISSDCYSIIGPFQQPYRVTSDGRKENLAGEDWDIGTRARLLGMSVARSTDEPIILSPRRFHANPMDFLDGTAYEREFQRVDFPSPSKDIDSSMFEQLLIIATYRQCMHHIEKPILADNSLLDRKEVKTFLGEQLHREIKRWIDSTPKPNMFSDRNAFILGYLSSFHEEFGRDINKQLLLNE